MGSNDLVVGEDALLTLWRMIRDRCEIPIKLLTKGEWESLDPVQKNSEIIYLLTDGNGTIRCVYKSVVIGSDLRGLAGPDGNPIGTIISYMGKTAPKDYLVCDGEFYSLRDYPQLAKFFKDQFGDEFYFGGSSEEGLFAVPDMQNPLSGDKQVNVAVLYCIKATEAEPYGDIYSLEETVVGRWIDGKPLYRKVYNTQTPAVKNSTVEVGAIPSGLSIKYFYGSFIDSSGNVFDLNWYGASDTFISIWINSNNNTIRMKVNQDAYTKRPLTVIVEYTKTIDIATIEIPEPAQAMGTVNHEVTLHPDEMNFAPTVSI